MLFDAILTIAEFLFVSGAAIWIGLWWLPSVSHGNLYASFVTATFAQVIGGTYLRRNIFGKTSRLKQYIYAALGGGGAIGYLYGIAVIYLKT